MSNDPCAKPSLIPVDDAIAAILESGNAITGTESVDVFDACGRVLAEDVCSVIDVLGHDNTAMDGYAVLSSDCAEAGRTLQVTQRIPAGTVGSRLSPGEAARIFTGAPIPPGADAVVMQEQCELDDSSEQGRVTINTTVSVGENIRRAGEDIKQDSVILKAGHKVRPQDMGLLASVGRASVMVKPRLRIATFFTGDEIITPGEPLAPGQIYNSNRYTLRGLIQSSGCECIDLGIVPDTLDATMDVLKQAAQQADLVITSGGVSVGEEDYVRIALEQLGELKMWRIAMKPGKPVAFGRVDDTLFMGLPGNPVSVFVTFLIFARGLVLKMQGCSDVAAQRIKVRADFEWPEVVRQEFVRARLVNRDDASYAEIYPHQGSGVLSSASWAHGLVDIPVGRAVDRGDIVDFLPFQGLFG
jgi:molybdopterin molybdotransferase